MDFRIGVIGLGNMGGPMAANLLAAGFAVIAFDVDQTAISRISAKGARVGSDPGQVAENSDAVITSLPSPEILEQVVLGDHGVLTGAKNGTILITTDTILPVTIQKIVREAAKRGVAVLDAPVSGGPHGARAATLTVMVGGDEGTFEKCLPIFKAIGRDAHHVGPSGAGCVTKLVNNLCSLANTASVCEAFVLGVKAGMDPKVLHKVILTGTGRSYALEHKIPDQIAKGNFEPGYTIKIARKDLSLIESLGKTEGVPLFMTNAVDQLFTLASANGLDEKDHVAVVKVLEDLAKVQVRF